jgi:hypothetical protein
MGSGLLNGIKNGTNSDSGTMGITSSRKVLFEPGTPRKSEKHPKWGVRTISTSDRLVCDKLCKEVQYCIHEYPAEVCDSIPFIQESSESIQQKDV